MYILGCTSDRIWNIPALIQYLVQHQHKPIVIDIQPEAICLRNLGLYEILDCFEFKSVCIQTWNPLETHPQYIIKYKGKNFFMFIPQTHCRPVSVGRASTTIPC